MSSLRGLVIGLTALWTGLTLTLNAFYEIVMSVFVVCTGLVNSLMNAKGLVIGLLLVAMGLIGLGATYEQPLIMKAIDVTYECGVEPLAEISFSIAFTMGAWPYRYFTHGFNQGVPYYFSTVGNYISNVKALGNPTTLFWYGEFFNETYILAKNLFFLWAYIPAWQIPYGVNTFFAGLIQYEWCIWLDTTETFIVQVIEFNMFNAYCPYCEYDPNSTCLIRQKWFPQAPDPPDANCTGCLNIPCILVFCTFNLLDNLTEPIQQALSINLTPTFEALAQDACCIISQSFPPILFIVVGVFEAAFSSGCPMFNSPGSTLDFVLNEWLFPLANCINQFIYDATFGYIDDILLLIFEALFPFIQDVIDTVIAIVDCTGDSTFISCLESYPDPLCGVATATLVPSSGLFVCAQTWGICVSTNAPLLSIPPFPTLLNSTIPLLIQYSIDLAVCNVFGLFTECLSGNAIASYPDPVTDPLCFMRGILCCMQTNTPFVDLATFLWSAISNLFSAIYDTCGAVETLCNFVSGSNCPSFGCGKINPNSCACPPGPYSADLRSAKITPTYSTKQLNTSTFCGHILSTFGTNTSIDWKKQDQWGAYLAQQLCQNTFFGASAYITNENAAADGDIVHSDLWPTPANFIFKYGNATKSKRGARKPPRDSYNLDKIVVEFHRRIHDSPYYRLLMRYAQERRRLLARYGSNSQEGIYGSIDLHENPSNAFDRASFMRNRAQEEEYLKFTLLDSLHDLNMRYRKPVPWHSKRLPGDYGRAGGPSNSGSEIASATQSAWQREAADEQYALRTFFAREMGFAPVVYDDYNVNQAGYKSYTREDLARARQVNSFVSEKVGGLVGSAKRIFNLFNHDGRLFERLAHYYGVESWAAYQNAQVALYMRDPLFAYDLSSSAHSGQGEISGTDGILFPALSSSEKVRESKEKLYARYLAGEVQFWPGEGFISLERYEKHLEIIANGRALEEEEREAQKLMDQGIYGPFLTSPRKRWLPALGQIFDANLIKKEHAKNLKKLAAQGGYNETQLAAMTEMEAIVALDPGLESVFNIFEYFINKVFGTLVHIIFNIRIHVDFTKLLQLVIDFFTGHVITVGSLTTFGTNLESFVTCHGASDYNGTNVYNPFCFPYLPEGALDWIKTVPNSLFKMQIAWPAEFIIEQCVNTFNGNGNLFFFQLSNNCNNMDNYTRPYCSAKIWKYQCQYCQREYGTCADVSNVHSPLASLFFTLGTIPILVDDFLNGGISTKTLNPTVLITATVVILWTAPITVMGPQIIAVPFIYWGVGFAIYSLDKGFSFFFKGRPNSIVGQTSGGGLPYGVIYIALLLYIWFFGSGVLQFSQGINIFLGLLAVLWFINIIYPLKSFQKVFNINQYAENFFYFLEAGPTPFKYYKGWHLWVQYARDFNFEKNPIKAVDISCYFWTIGNMALLIALGYAGYWFVYWLWLVIVAILVWVFGIMALLFYTASAFNQWYVNGQTVKNTEDLEKTMEKIRSHTLILNEVRNLLSSRGFDVRYLRANLGISSSPPSFRIRRQTRI